MPRSARATAAAIAPARASTWFGLFLTATLAGVVWLLLAAPASAESPVPDANATRVMFVGDSITGSPGCWRADVWVALSEAGYDVDMVGSRTADECGGVTDAEGRLWDPDNLGIGGTTAVRMNNKLALESTLATFDPDVVVLMIGTNDIRGGSTAADVIDQYSLFLSQLRDHDPDASLVVSRLLPIGPLDCPDCQPVVDAVNAALPDWAAEHSTADSPIVVAAPDAGFDVATDTADHLHPNAQGDAKVADAIAPALMEALDARDISAGEVPTWLVLAGLGPLLIVMGAVLINRNRIRRALQD